MGKPAQWEFVDHLCSLTACTIKDVGDHRERLTVTNDIENVVRGLLRSGKLRPGMRLVYFDSEGLANTVEWSVLAEVTPSRPDPAGGMDFIECEACRVKPGAPILCASCRNNRAVISHFQEAYRQLLKKHKELSAAILDGGNQNKPSVDKT